MGDVNLELARHLGQAPAIQWPIQLTPKAPFHMGVAALVFVSPHVLSPADDVAEFGVYPLPQSQEQKEEHRPLRHGPPHEGAHVVAWLRPPELNRDYNVEFTCLGMAEGTFDLEASDGGTETVDVPGDYTLAGVTTNTVNVSSNFVPQEHKWLWFSLTSGFYWKLLSFEITILP
jgi:hypothetical protein